MGYTVLQTPGYLKALLPPIAAPGISPLLRAEREYRRPFGPLAVPRERHPNCGQSCTKCPLTPNGPESKLFSDVESLPVGVDGSQEGRMRCSLWGLGVLWESIYSGDILPFLRKWNMKGEFILVGSKRGSIIESILSLIMCFFHHSNSIFRMQEPL